MPQHPSPRTSPSLAPPPLALTFLGTRDGARSRRENTSAILVEHASGCLLVDAGIGVGRQLDRCGRSVHDVDAILLTHWHPDHVAGLPRLAARRWRLRIPVYAPPPPRGLGPVVAAVMRHVRAAPGHELELGGLRCTAFATEHRGATVGWLLADAEGRRIALPGDTRPTPAVAEAIVGADLLVYEATFTEADADWAHRSGHSTALEAGELARRAAVGALVLTHLSLRYPTEEVQAQAAAAYPGALVARDLDRLAVLPTGSPRPTDPGWARVELQRAPDTD